MMIPDDLTVDIRHGVITLASGGRIVTFDYGHKGKVFQAGPIRWTDIITRYLAPALYQLSERASRPHLHDIERRETCWCGAAPGEPHHI